MENLFEAKIYSETVDRINKLTHQTQGLWGKMKVAQMMAHCQAAFLVPITEKPLPRIFIGRLIGWAFKKQLYNDDAWKKSLPTAPNFIIKDERDFETEKKKLLSLMEKFYTKGTTGIGDKVHPMFGKFTAEQWGKSMYKHLDHHLRQFGV